MFGRAKAVRRACDSTCDANLFERKGRHVTPHVMQISLGAYVVTLAKRPSPQMAQNFHSRYEDFPYFGMRSDVRMQRNDGHSSKTFKS